MRNVNIPLAKVPSVTLGHGEKKRNRNAHRERQKAVTLQPITAHEAVERNENDSDSACAYVRHDADCSPVFRNNELVPYKTQKSSQKISSKAWVRIPLQSPLQCLLSNGWTSAIFDVRASLTVPHRLRSLMGGLLYSSVGHVLPAP